MTVAAAVCGHTLLERFGQGTRPKRQKYEMDLWRQSLRPIHRLEFIIIGRMMIYWLEFINLFGCFGQIFVRLLDVSPDHRITNNNLITDLCAAFFDTFNVHFHHYLLFRISCTYPTVLRLLRCGGKSEYFHCDSFSCIHPFTSRPWRWSLTGTSHFKNVAALGSGWI